MKLELTNDKLACYLVGYITQKAIIIKPAYQEILQHKIRKEKDIINKDVLHNIFRESVKIISNNGTDELNDILELASYYMIQSDNDDALNKVDISYYYTLGLTSKDITIKDGCIIV